MDEGCARRIPGSIPGQRTSGAASPHVHSPFGPKGPCRSTVWLAGLRQLRGKGNICRTQRRMEETNMPTNGTTLPGRSLAEIRASLGAHIRMAAESCILAGQDLIEAKDQLGHGQWLPFLNEFGISSSTAANWMKVAREVSLESPLARMRYGKVLALLAVPADEREAFAGEIQAEDKSAAEIRRLIEERNKAAEAANAETTRAAQIERDRDYWKTQAGCIEQERKQAEQAKRDAVQRANILSQQLDDRINNPEKVEVRVEVPPADYDELKRKAAMADRNVDDALLAARDAEQRARDAEDRLAMMEARGCGKPILGDLERLTDAVNRFISDTQMMAVNPGELARREKETDAIIRRLSRHVIELQKAVGEAAFQAEGAVV